MPLHYAYKSLLEAAYAAVNIVGLARTPSITTSGFIDSTVDCCDALYPAATCCLTDSTLVESKRALDWLAVCHDCMSHNSVYDALLIGRSLTEVLRVCEQVNLATLTLHSKVMAELALETFCALPCSEILAHNGLGVNTCTTVICQVVHSRIQSVNESVSQSVIQSIRPSVSPSGIHL